MADTGTPSLRIVQSRMEDGSLPPAVQENVRQHFENLSRLADDLRRLGMDEGEIDSHVLEIFREYERELAANIGRIRATQENVRPRNAG